MLEKSISYRAILAKLPLLCLCALRRMKLIGQSALSLIPFLLVNMVTGRE